MANLVNLRRAAEMLDSDLRWRWVGLSMLSVFAAILETIGAFGVLWLIGIVHSPAEAVNLPVIGPLAVKLGYDGSPAWVIWCSVAVMVFYASKNAFLMFHYYLEVRLPQDACVRVSTALLRGYLSTGYSFHFYRNSAEVIGRLINSVDIVFRIVLHNAVTLVSELLLVLAILGVLVISSPRGALVAGGILSILAWVILRLTQRRVSEWGAQGKTLSKEVLKVSNEALGAVKEIKVLHRENFFLKQYRDVRVRQSQIVCFHETFLNIPRLTLEAAFVLLLGCLLILVAINPGDHALTIPLLGLYGYAGFRLLPALARIAAKLQRLDFGSAALRDVYKDYNRIARDAQLPAPDIPPLPFTRDIRLDDVSYSYPKSGGVALQNVSITISFGSSVGIVGPSGAGKSTLIDVILGLLNPDSGRVLVDGADIFAAVSAWQSNLGYVPQSAYLLDDTIRRNIAFGVPDSEISETRIAQSVQMSQLADLVATLPKGLDTKIGERGILLSGGQRQRIIIARALYREPDVLVFDEATSALDTQTEREISSAIDSLSGQKTIIIIAHRMTTVRNCDSIIFLVDGRVADVGNYDELLERSPQFRQLALTHSDVAADVETNGGVRVVF
jgi:ATP-binding cassette, subfamily B, bacterial PglK